MHIEEVLDGSQLTLKLDGRLDTFTAPQLEHGCGSQLKEVDLLVLDCSSLTYVSSAGLRVLLSAHKTMREHGRMVLRHVSGEIMEIFDITGFIDILDIE